MGKEIILEDNLLVRKPTILEKLNILMQRCDTLQGQVLGCLDAINDLSRATQKVAMSPEQRVEFVKEVFKIQLYRTATQCQLSLQSGQLATAQSFRKLLDGEYEKRAKELKTQSYYNKVMRKLANGTLDPKMPDKEFGIKQVKKS